MITHYSALRETIEYFIHEYSERPTAQPQYQIARVKEALEQPDSYSDPFIAVSLPMRQIDPDAHAQAIGGQQVAESLKKLRNIQTHFFISLAIVSLASVALTIVAFNYNSVYSFLQDPVACGSLAKYIAFWLTLLCILTPIYPITTLTLARDELRTARAAYDPTPSYNI